VAAGCWFAVLAAAFFLLTYQRNSVFASEPAYYLDLIKKAPSSRAYVNYGLTLMRTGRYQEALGHYKKALELAPNWHIIHINMGIAYQHLGDTGLARYHFDRAVATEEYSAYALLYRAEFRLKQKQYGAALNDLQNAVSLSRDYFRLYKSMACAYAGLGNGEKSLEYARRCHDLDLQGTEVEIVGISQPFWEDPARYKAGIQFFKGIDAMYPHRWWVFQNIGDLANKMGLAELAQQSFEEARRLRQTEAANPRK
jgi:tetratricopeptide (TPR) repeat protein